MAQIICSTAQLGRTSPPPSSSSSSHSPSHFSFSILFPDSLFNSCLYCLPPSRNPPKLPLLMGWDSSCLYYLPHSHIPQNSHFFNGMGLPLLAAAVSPTIAAPMTSILSWNSFPPLQIAMGYTGNFAMGYTGKKEELPRLLRQLCNEIFWELCNEIYWELCNGLYWEGVLWVMAQLMQRYGCEGLAYLYLQIAPISQFQPIPLKSTLFGFEQGTHLPICLMTGN